MEKNPDPQQPKAVDKQNQIVVKGKTSKEIVDQEIESILKLWPNDYVHIEHQPLMSIKIGMEYSVNKQLDIQFIYPSVADVGEDLQYPNSSVVIKLKSKRMPHKLVETLLKKAENMIKKLVTTPMDGFQGSPQTLPVFDFIESIMENNNLIPAWNELASIKSLLRLQPKVKQPEGENKDSFQGPYDEIRLYEKAGKLRVKLKEGEFFLDLELTVPEEYPAARPEMAIMGHNYDQNFAKIFEATAEQILRRLWQGGEPAYEPGSVSDINKGKIGTRKAKGTLATEMEKMKLLDDHELKHDVEFMNTATQLRHQAEDGDKKAKKFMKLKMKHEAAYEENLREEEEKIQEALGKKAVLNLATAKPSLYHVVRFLTLYFVRYLPSAKCPVCNKKLVCKIKSPEDKRRPERAYCSHWMHYQCFEDYTSQPPFLRLCPVEKCGQMLGSREFPLDEHAVKNREKVYMQNEQKKGEMDDIDRLLGM